MSKVILSQPWGGLGDNLQYSTLPRLYTEKNIEFYISTHNTYRNDEIFNFVWKNNPYVKGILDLPGNVGACTADLPLGTTDNIISYSEIKHGFEGQNRYPEIYYVPNFIPELKNKIIVDLTAISIMKQGVGSLYNIDILNNYINQIPDDALLVRFNKINIETLPNKFNSFIEINSLEDYADIISSCKEYYCLYSGGNILSAGLKHRFNLNLKINCFLHGHLSDHRNRGFYVFDNVNYIEIH